MERVVFGADHAGVGLKTILAKYLDSRFEVLDIGTHSLESCDYPVIAQRLALTVLEKNCLGILICGSGIGMSIAANKVCGIRAALCVNEYMAKMSRIHNDANVLCLGERVVGIDLAKAIMDSFLAAVFEGGRHQRRIDLFEGQPQRS